MSITIFSHPDCELHNPDPEHPECPERIAAIQDQLIRSGLDYVLRQKEATAAPLEAVYRAHSKAYVDELQRMLPADGHVWLDPDTPITGDSFRAALAAAGAAINAVDEVMQGKEQQAFCAIRPPGHHATYDQGMGFCLLNNVAIAACHALHDYPIERVAIIDFDVHHGNGTEDIFQNDERVLLCSSFQSQLYPFTGDDTDNAHIVNIPLPAGTKSLAWREAVYHGWLPALEAFKPQLILISAGFDGHAEEEMAHFFLVEDDYFWITEKLKRVAEQHAEGRVVSVLEGGYNLSALGRSVVAHLKGLL
ncbi:histone deacetylase family protein [Aliidiomarina soli]|uniref:Deacetylase n=1 Tax=Aliidiomarina soli TaxID=1928574 RepID=A0A432WHR2_9GAMM|nr:histone deacetylase family protein [Aliidiomarina soli]RUO33340.1 deacetylase [Aliidiomarina soli]